MLLWALRLRNYKTLHLLFLPARAVMGLDRESDAVHIETRVAKGRECCTPSTPPPPPHSFAFYSESEGANRSSTALSLKCSKAE